jgi:hypothetical protein
MFEKESFEAGVFGRFGKSWVVFWNNNNNFWMVSDG